MFNLGRWKEHFNKAVLINGTSKEKHEINLTRIMIPFQLFFIPHNGSSLIVVWELKTAI